MQDYNAFIKNTTHFQPRLILEIGGVDVSHRLIEDHSVQTDSLLDTPIYNVYTTSSAYFCLDNSDDLFNTKKMKLVSGKLEPDNFFTRLTPSRDADGWRTPVKVSVVFDNTGAPSEARVLFVGFIERIEEMRNPRWVKILVLDKSGLLQHAVVDDFGVESHISLFGPRFTEKYSEANPIFSIPSDFLPISRESVSSVRIGRDELEVLPDIPLGGAYADYKYVSVNYETGDVFLGGEPPDKENTGIRIRFKSAYRYRTPEALVNLLLDASGIYDSLTDEQKAFSKTLIKSPELSLENSPAEWYSHGRPQSPPLQELPAHATTDVLPSPVVRCIQAEGEAFYFAGDRRLFRYQKRGEADGAEVLDHYDTLWESEGSGLLGGNPIIDFVKVPGEDVFYALTVGDWQGRACRLWKIENAQSSAATAANEISNARATACHFYDYDTLEIVYGYNPQASPTADNRKNFVVHDGYLYYVSASYTGSVGDRRAVSSGIRRLKLSDDSLQDVDVVTGNAALVSDMSWDFVIDEDTDTLYSFHCSRPGGSTNRLRINAFSLSGGKYWFW